MVAAHAAGHGRGRGRWNREEKKSPAGRYGEHHELTNLASYLLADESAYITGEVVAIDGGEWLMGGEFNGFTTLDQNAVGQMFDAMKPKKH